MKQNQIFNTKKYDIFKKLQGNRPINAANLRDIIDNMKIEYNPVPIIINENYEIIDGQHRVEACRALDLPVDFIQRNGWGLKHAQRLNRVSKHWDARDYAISFEQKGNKNYSDFLKFIGEYHFSVATTIALLMDVPHSGGKIMEAFFDGKFKVKNYSSAVLLANQLNEIGELFSKHRKQKFITAMLTVMHNKNYVHKHFIHKLKTFPSLMVDCPSHEEFMKIIEKVYNYQNKSEKVRFF